MSNAALWWFMVIAIAAVGVKMVIEVIGVGAFLCCLACLIIGAIIGIILDIKAVDMLIDRLNERDAAIRQATQEIREIRRSLYREGYSHEI